MGALLFIKESYHISSAVFLVKEEVACVCVCDCPHAYFKFLCFSDCCVLSVTCLCFYFIYFLWQSVIVKTIESNTQNVYEARRRILGLAQEVPMCEMKSGWLPAGRFISECVPLSAEIILYFKNYFSILSIFVLKACRALHGFWQFP